MYQWLHPPLTFQVEPGKVVQGEPISQVGRDLSTNPLAFEIKNLGPATATVSQAETVTAVKFELVGTDKVVLEAGVNNPTGTHQATVRITRGDFALDDDLETDDDDAAANSIDVPIEAALALVFPLQFVSVESAAIDMAPLDTGAAGTGFITINDDNPYHYEVTIPETALPGSGVLPYHVRGAKEPVVAGNTPAISGEKVTGVIGGTSAHLFRVNNDTMAIEYAGPADGLVAGEDHILRITASGDRGLANRLIVGMAKITIADVDSPPSKPEPQAAEISENDTGMGLVRIKDSDDEDIEVLVMDFDGISTDPEGRALRYTVSTDDFKFVEVTKLVVADEIGDSEKTGDNPATTDVQEDNWPSSPPSEWSFVENPPTNRYP